MLLVHRRGARGYYARGHTEVRRVPSADDSERRVQGKDGRLRCDAKQKAGDATQTPADIAHHLCDMYEQACEHMYRWMRARLYVCRVCAQVGVVSDMQTAVRIAVNSETCILLIKRYK